MTAGGRFHLDRDQRQDVLDCLKDTVRSLVEPLDRFFEQIEASIDHYRHTEPEGTLREAYSSAREIWLLCKDDQPNPAPLRTLLRKLPPRVRQHLGRRARIVIPRLFGEPFENDPFEPPDRFATRFLAWADSVPDDKLVRALRALLTDGGQLVKGRSRGNGKRSAPRFEPRIMGVVRGSPEAKSMGGRPSEDARQGLVMHLAVDWFWATGRMPEPGRSDRTMFGKLVHMVFEWVYVREAASQKAIDEAIESATAAATYCLRRYWEEVEQGRLRPPLEDFLRRHADEL